MAKAFDVWEGSIMSTQVKTAFLTEQNPFRNPKDNFRSETFGLSFKQYVLFFMNFTESNLILIQLYRAAKLYLLPLKVLAGSEN